VTEGVFRRQEACPPMAEWPRVIKGNIAHTLIDGKHIIGCWACDLQRMSSIVLPRFTECRRGLAMRILSVCPSDVNYDKTEEKSVKIFIPYERPFSLVF